MNKNAISLIRMISFIFIIACHILQGLGNELAFWFNVGVQIFFVVSGFLFAQKEIKNAKEWYIKRIKRIMVPYLLFLVIFVLFKILISHDYVNPKALVSAVLGLQGFTSSINGLSHTWFISYILICYLITPLLQKLDIKQLKPLKFYINIFLIILAIQILYTFGIINIFPPYICCYILGYFLSKRYINNNTISKKEITNAFIMLIAITFILLPIRIMVQYGYGSLSFLEPLKDLITGWHHTLLGLSIFAIFYIIFSKLNLSKIEKIVKFSDKYSYYIYLTHHIFILGSYSLLKLTNILSLNIIIIIACTVVSALLLYYIDNIVETKILIRKKETV